MVVKQHSAFISSSFQIGLKLKCIACSVTSMILVCDDGKLIAWGASPTYGELVRINLSAYRILCHSLIIIFEQIFTGYR